MKPLVSIIVPAYNAEHTIAQTLESAIWQTWDRKEIIVVNDGSTDRTAQIAHSFESKGVTVVSTENRGLSAAQNEGFRYSRGDYIQWLDSDDLLALDKIEKQLDAVHATDSKRVLLSSPWAPFYYRTNNVRFVRNSLWQDLSPVEWLLRKLGGNLHMQNATWLVSRELTEAAGPWDENLHHDQDGEYFARVLLASKGTRFVPGTGIFYRASPSNRISYVGNSDKKKDSLFRSIRLHIQYLRSLEDSERVRKACIFYMQTWYPHFYPTRPDIVAELEAIAAELQGYLTVPRLSWKYAWIKPMLGWNAVIRLQHFLPEFKSSFIRQYDKAMFKLQGGPVVGTVPVSAFACRQN
jgi:glycosyltransferase involved in cell wall biosynthesis